LALLRSELAKKQEELIREAAGRQEEQEEHRREMEGNDAKLKV
jgi:hypothetical protein